MTKLSHATAVEDFGLQGDRHARPKSSRQVLLIELETPNSLGIPVSEVKENITTRGVQLMTLRPGHKLQLGESVLLEITKPCDPCNRMEEIRPGLQLELQGRRGMLTRVIRGGVISIGDPIREVS